MMPTKQRCILHREATDVELHYCGQGSAGKGCREGVSHVFCACQGTEGLLWTSRLAGFTQHKTSFPLTKIIHLTAQTLLAGLYSNSKRYDLIILFFYFRIPCVFFII